MNSTKISFVIPAHNERDHIEDCIRCIRLSADEKNYEIIVVISASCTDQTSSISESLSVRTIHSNHTSRAIQMNEGAAQSTGDTLCFVHADVLLPSTAYDDILDAIQDEYQAGYFSYQFSSTHPLLKINSRISKNSGIFSGGGDQSLFIKKDVFNTLHGFDERVKMMEDFKLFEQIKKHKIPFTIVQNESIVSARKYANNSYLKVNLVNGIIFTLFKMGVDTAYLKRWYNKWLSRD